MGEQAKESARLESDDPRERNKVPYVKGDLCVSPSSRVRVYGLVKVIGLGEAALVGETCIPV